MDLATTNIEFDFLRQLVREKTGIAIREDQEYILASRLTPLLRKVDMASISDLVFKLKHDSDCKLELKVMEAMTNHETSFFRDIHQFETLKNDILPELIQRKPGSSDINIWSAACATGQEPYSVAMIVSDHYASQLATRNVNILATDISEIALQSAKEGQYNQLEISRGLPAQLLVRHFAQQDATWQASPFLRSLVEFKQTNLIDMPPFMPKMDVIFLRNALIYFDDETKGRVLRNIYDVLAEGGYLFLGVGESPRGHIEEIETIPANSTIYFRKPLPDGGA